MSGWDGRAGLAAVMTPERPRERFVGGGSEPVFYSNVIQVEKSTHDVKLQLGVVLSAQPGELTTRVIATVYLSHVHAAALRDLLAQVLTPAEVPV